MKENKRYAHPAPAPETLTFIVRVKHPGQDLPVAHRRAGLVLGGNVEKHVGRARQAGPQVHAPADVDAEQLLGEPPVRRDAGPCGHGGMAG